MVDDVRQPLDSATIIGLIASTGEEPWGVDVPFGWPDGFVDLMATRHRAPLSEGLLPAEGDWAVWRTRDIAQRRTDAFLTHHEQVLVRPLPAAFQMLGSTAAMWVLIESRLASIGINIDRSGAQGRVFETYPRAALAGWGHRQPGKTDLSTLEAVFPVLRVAASWRSAFDNDHACDALVCALVSRARDLGLTVGPPAEDAAAARREGWIHVSLDSSDKLTNTDLTR